MELTNAFRVGLPVEEAWLVLTDLERIAPCMPGAQLQEVEGEEYRGVVKVKVGPITAQYKGQATFLDRDDTNHVAVLRAEGRETRGQGNANATITATLTADGTGTAVTVLTDLTVTGRVAQFGRGVLSDVSAKLLGQFVDCLEQTVLAGGPDVPSAPAAEHDAAATRETELVDAPPVVPDQDVLAEPRTAAPAPVVDEPRAAPRRIDHPEAQPVDLLSTAGSPVAKRVGPILALIALVWLLKKLFGRSKT